MSLSIKQIYFPQTYFYMLTGHKLSSCTPRGDGQELSYATFFLNIYGWNYGMCLSGIKSAVYYTMYVRILRLVTRQ